MAQPEKFVKGEFSQIQTLTRHSAFVPEEDGYLDIWLTLFASHQRLVIKLQIIKYVTLHHIEHQNN